jgi:acetolactate synthase-like protein
MFWKADVKVNSDPCDFMLKVLETGNTNKWEDWLTECRKRDEKRELEIDQSALAPAEDKINPLKLFRELDAFLPQNAIIVADGGDFVGTASYILRPKKRVFNILTKKYR